MLTLTMSHVSLPAPPPLPPTPLPLYSSDLVGAFIVIIILYLFIVQYPMYIYNTSSVD